MSQEPNYGDVGRQIDPRIAELANALAESVERGLATRAQVLSAMQLAFQGGEIAGSLQTCEDWDRNIKRVTHEN